jgi:hypothetical protein
MISTTLIPTACCKTLLAEPGPAGPSVIYGLQCRYVLRGTCCRTNQPTATPQQIYDDASCASMLRNNRPGGGTDDRAAASNRRKHAAERWCGERKKRGAAWRHAVAVLPSTSCHGRQCGCGCASEGHAGQVSSRAGRRARCCWGTSLGFAQRRSGAGWAFLKAEWKRRDETQDGFVYLLPPLCAIWQQKLYETVLL